MNDRVGIEYLSALGLPPLDFVRLAAELGCHLVSLGAESGPPAFDPPRSPPYSLVDDAPLRRALTAALDDHGVRPSLGEGCVVVPGLDVSRHRPALDAFAELGVPRVNTLSFDRDRSRSVDQFAALAELAAGFGIATVIETSRGFVPTDLPVAVEVQREIGRDDVTLLVDTMHVVRSGARPGDLAALDPAILGYVQLCDVPLVSTRELSYLDEALYDRKVPGDGELPLLELLAAVPRDVVVGLEVPNRAAASTRDGLVAHLRRAVTATHELLAELDAGAEGLEEQASGQGASPHA